MKIPKNTIRSTKINRGNIERNMERKIRKFSRSVVRRTKNKKESIIKIMHQNIMLKILIKSKRF